MSYSAGKHIGKTDVVVPPSFSTSEPCLILCGGDNDAIPASSELLWKSSICDIVVDLDCRQDLGRYFGRRWVRGVG